MTRADARRKAAQAAAEKGTAVFDTKVPYPTSEEGDGIPRVATEAASTPAAVAPSPSSPKRPPRRDDGLHTPRRSIRIGDELWAAVGAKAKKQGETISDVTRRAYEEYVK